MTYLVGLCACLLTAPAPLLVEEFTYPDGPFTGADWAASGGEFTIRDGRLVVESERSNPVMTWRGELDGDVTIEATLVDAPTCHWSGLLVRSRYTVTVNRQFGHLAIADTQAEGGARILAECGGWATYVNDPYRFRLRVATEGDRIYAFADDRLMAEAGLPEAGAKGGLALLGGWGTSVAWDDVTVRAGADLHARPQEVPADVRRSDAVAVTAARWDDPHGIYAPGQEAKLALSVTGPAGGAFEGVLRLRLVDFWGAQAGVQTMKLDVAAGEKVDLAPLFSPPGPGVFKVAVDAGPSEDKLEWVEDLMSLAVVDPSPAADRQPRPDSIFGGHVDAIRLDWHLDLAKRLGMRWLRDHDAIQWTWWTRAEPENDQWKWYDEGLQSLRDRGLLLLGEFLHCPAWAADAPPGVDLTGSHYKYSAYPPRDWEEFGEYVYETVRHYRGRIDNWEIWNEPYYAGFWKGTPEQYARLAQIAYRECKRADPGCTVWGACTHLSATEWLERALEAGLADAMDGLSMHGYSDTATAGSPHSPYGGVERLRGMLAEHGRRDVRIWDTEAGVPSTSFLDQYRAGVSEPDAKYHYRNAAGELVRMYVEHAAAGIEKLFYYNCIFTKQPWPARPEAPRDAVSNALTDAGGMVKPTGVAYATCAALLEDARFREVLDLEPGGRAYVFGRGRRTVVVLLGGSLGFVEKRSVVLPRFGEGAGPGIELRDVMNHPVRPELLQAGDLELSVGRLPLFLMAEAAPEGVVEWLRQARSPKPQA